MSSASSSGLKHRESLVLKTDFGSRPRILATALLIFGLSQLLAGALISGLAGLGGWSTQSAALQFCYIFLAETLAVFGVLKILKVRGLTRKSIGLVRPKLGDIPRALLAFVAFYAVLLVILSIAILLVPELDTHQKQLVGFEPTVLGIDRLLAFVGLVILPPLAEEILIRGYLYSGLRRSLAFAPAALFTSLLFGLAHLELGAAAAPLWIAAINTFVLSLVLVYLREKAGSLWPPIMVHSLNNLVAFISFIS